MTNRTYMSSPDGFQINTKFGPMLATVTNENHICVRTPPNASIRVNGVEYHATVHAYRYPDGRFRVGNPQEDNEYIRYLNALSIRRSNFDLASGSARTKVIQEITKQIDEWAQQNPEVFRLANRCATNNELLNLENERAELMEKLAALDEKITMLKKEEEAYG